MASRPDYLKLQFVKTTWDRIGFAVSCIGLIELLVLGYNLGVNAAVKAVIDSYAALLEFLFDPWAERWLRSVSRYLADLTGIHISIYPHWKLLFVPMFFYLRIDSKTMAANRRPWSAVFFFAWGTLIALVSSVAAATVPVDTQSTLPLIAMAGGFVSYSAVSGIWDAIFHVPSGYTARRILLYHWLAYAFGNVVIAAVLILAAGPLAAVNFPNLGLTLLLAFIFLMALRNVAVAVFGATFRLGPGEQWIDRFAFFVTGRHGVVVIVGFICAIGIVSLGAAH